MSDMICAACRQPLAKAPERCFICRQSIGPGKPFTHFKHSGICQPAHPACLDASQTS